MNDDAALPEVYVAAIDRQMLRTIVADISRHGELLQVNARGEVSAVAERTDASGLEAFVDDAPAFRACRGIQIRYRHAQQVWIDTITRTGDDVFRLVRMRSPESY